MAKKLIFLSLAVVFIVANFQYAKNYVFYNKTSISESFSMSEENEESTLNKIENRLLINTLTDINNSRLIYKQICMLTARKDCSKNVFQFAIWFVKSQYHIKKKLDTLALSNNFRLPIIPVNKSSKELDELKKSEEQEFDAKFKETLIKYCLRDKEKLSKYLLSEDKDVREIAQIYISFTEEQLTRLSKKN